VALIVAYITSQQAQQNAQVHLRVLSGPLCPTTENQVADGPGLIFAGGVGGAATVFETSRKGQTGLHLSHTVETWSTNFGQYS
jgi:hypothetical protein